VQALTSVIDENIDPAEGFERPLDQPLDLVRCSDIGLDRERVRQLGRKLAQTLSPAGRKHDTRPALAQYACSRGSDAR
jgi:hypothetical protein